MARTGIGYREVELAAEKLVQQGDNPTIERIRMVLGTGSNSTVSKYLNEWKVTHLKKRIDAVPVMKTPSDQVNLAVAKVWEQLQTDNALKIEEIERAAAEKIQLAEEEKIFALNESTQLKLDNQNLRALLKEVRDQNSNHEKQQIELTQSLAVVNTKLAVFEEGQQSFQIYATQTLQSLEEKYQSMQTSYEMQLQERKVAYEKELDSIKDNAESQRHKHIVEIDSLKLQVQRLQGQLADKDKDWGEINRTVGRLNTQLQRQQENIGALLSLIQQSDKKLVNLETNLIELGEAFTQANHKQTEKLLALLQQKSNSPGNKRPVKVKPHEAIT